MAVPVAGLVAAEVSAVAAGLVAAELAGDNPDPLVFPPPPVIDRTSKVKAGTGHEYINYKSVRTIC
jgi:hypothetical protein